MQRLRGSRAGIVPAPKAAKHRSEEAVKHMEIKRLGEFTDFQESRFTKRIVHKQDESVVFVLNFQDGQQLPPHKHPGTQVYILVLQGQGVITVDGRETEIGKNDIVRVGGDEEFSFANAAGEKTSLYVCLNKIPDERYAEEI